MLCLMGKKKFEEKRVHWSKSLWKSLWSRSARRCCLLSGNQLILQLPLTISRLNLCLKRGKNGGKKGHFTPQHKTRLLFHSTCTSCYENEENIKQLRPHAALDLFYAIIVTGSLYSCKECFFLKFNNCFHDTDVHWTVFITLWNGYPVLYIGSF